MNIRDILMKIRAKIENPDDWLQGCFARNTRNKTVDIDSEDACKFCIVACIGAVAKTYNEQKIIVNILEKVLSRRSSLNLYLYNDAPTTTHGCILSLIDETLGSLPGLS